MNPDYNSRKLDGFYILENVLTSFLVHFIIWLYIYIPLKWASSQASLLIWLGITLAVHVAAFLLTLGINHTGLDSLTNSLFAQIPYLLLSHTHTVVHITAWVSTLVAALFVMLNLFHLLKRCKQNYTTVTENQLQHIVNGTQRLVLLGSCAVLIASLVSGIIPERSKNAKVSADDLFPKSDVDVMLDNETYLSKLYDESWTSFSDEEKLSVLQVVADTEKEWLGIPFDVPVKAMPLRKGSIGMTAAEYTNELKEIHISEEILSTNSPEDLIDSIAHEMRHAYQYCIMEAWLSTDEAFRKLKIYDPARKLIIESLKVEDDVDLDDAMAIGEYMQRYSEIDAQTYAQGRSEFYKIVIGK